MSRVDVEEIQTTRSEKLLADILVVFLLIGGVWTYQKIDDYVRDRVERTRPALELARGALDRTRARRDSGGAPSTPTRAGRPSRARDPARGLPDSARGKGADPPARAPVQARRCGLRAGAARAVGRRSFRGGGAARSGRGSPGRPFARRPRRATSEALHVRVPPSLRARVDRRRILAARPPPPSRLSVLSARRLRCRFLRDHGARFRWRLRHRLLRPIRPGRSRARLDRRGRDARRLLCAPALPLAAVAGKAGTQASVSVLRLSGRCQRRVRRLRTRRPRAVRSL